MSKRIIFYILGWVLIIEGFAMQIGTITSFLYRENEGFYFLGFGGFCAVVGALSVKFCKTKNMVLYQKEGFAATALSWIVMSFAGCVPFVVSGEIPSFIDAFFETVSGFTTTGSTILTDIDSMSHGMLIWRSFLHWLGGMGVIVFLLAIIPKLGGQQNIFLMKAESPGPIVGKALPHMRNYAAMLYGIYTGLTIIEFILLAVGGMPVFDALNISFATAGTGGFGVHTNNIAAYNSYYLQAVIAVFMMLFGINFSFYILLISKKLKQAFNMQELWVYLGIIAVSTFAIAINIRALFPTMYDAFHQSFFYVSSIITTTGFGIVDVNQWPEFSKVIIVIITFIGAMAGSTGGGLKVSRMILLFKEIKNEFFLLLHPRNVKSIKMDGKNINQSVIKTTNVFLFLYILIFSGSLLIISLENKDFLTSFTAVAANINNTGPGLGMVGPVGNYSDFSVLSKIVLIFDMLAGRLELFPLVLLFLPSAWKKS